MMENYKTYAYIQNIACEYNDKIKKVIEDKHKFVFISISIT